MTRGLPVILYAALCMAPVYGQELVAGWEGQSGRGYAFIAPSVETPSREGHRAVFRVAGSYLYYDYPDFDARTEVRSPGAGLVIAYRFTGPRFSFTAGPGVEVRRTSRQRAGERSVTTEAGPTLQAELFAPMGSRVLGSAIVSYGHANRYTWARGSLLYRLSDAGSSGPVRLAAGVEGTGQGNPDARSTQLGGVLELQFSRPALSAQVRAGVAVDDGSTRKPYAGVGIYRRF